MRKVLSLVLVALMLLTGSVAAFAEAQQPNELTIVLGTRPNLDPHWNAGSTGALLMNQIYEGLYNYTETGFELAGATEVNVSEDGMTWTFKLREDAKWSDGKPVVAQDYVNSMRRLVDPEISTIYMNDYGQFLKNGPAISKGEMKVEELGVKAIDDYTLEIQLENVCAFFDALLCYSTFYPLRTDTFEEDGLGNWAWDVSKLVTNGPLKMIACDEEQEMVFDKNENYWNKDNIKLDKLTVKLVDDTNTVLSLLTTGEADLVFDYPSEETETMAEQGLFHSYPNLATNFLLVNNTKEPYNDPRVRKALSMTIDREFVCEVLFMNTKDPATGYIGHGFPGASDEKDFRSEGGDLLSYDPEGARKLLKEAGYENGENFPVLEIAFSNSNADFKVLFEYMQAVWEEELGIKVQLTPMENAAMAEQRDAGKFDITPQGWGADYVDVSNMLSIFVTGNFINGGRYSNEIYDKTFEEALVTMDKAERMEKLHIVENTLVAEDMGIIPLYHSSYKMLYDENVVSNVRVNSNSKVILTDVVVTK